MSQDRDYLPSDEFERRMESGTPVEIEKSTPHLRRTSEAGVSISATAAGSAQVHQGKVERGLALSDGQLSVTR